jgi:hypothetical protein
MTSKIKVDNINKVSDDSNIIKKCGTTTTIGSGASNPIVVDGSAVTLGRCGGTVALASGATQTGFGRTGTVDWQTSIKTSTITVVSGEGYFVNTTGGAITANLPAGSAGAIASFRDYANTFDSNALTINSNGSEKINGATLDLIVSTEGEALTLVYADATKGWLVVNDGNNDAGAQAEFIVASGGNVTSTCGNFKTVIFTGPGTFCVSATGNPAGSNTVEYLVVAGGGSGGDDQGGGAGAGGFRSFTALSPASPLNGPAAISVTAQGYAIVVGGGAPGGNSSRGSGSPSSALGIVSTGGGGGGDYGGTPLRPGDPGGSGGGAGSRDTSGPGTIPGGTGNDPAVSPAQGKPGGPISGPGAGSYGAGGGGASTAGAEDISTGGDGSFVPTGFIGPESPNYGEPGSSPPSTPRAAGQYFAGGGGGRPISNPSGGGVGGGGPATNNGSTNMGGGGGYGQRGSNSVGAGGSGIVMIRYKFQ